MEFFKPKEYSSICTEIIYEDDEIYVADGSVHRVGDSQPVLTIRFKKYDFLIYFSGDDIKVVRKLLTSQYGAPYAEIFPLAFSKLSPQQIGVLLNHTYNRGLADGFARHQSEIRKVLGL